MFPIALRPLQLQLVVLHQQAPGTMVRTYGLQCYIGSAAVRYGISATRMKSAPRRKVDRIRHCARNHFEPLLTVAEARPRLEQAHRVRMLGIPEQFARGSRLDDLP